MNPLLPLAAVAAALAACRSTHDVRIDPSRPSRTFRFVYRAAVEDVPPGARSVRLWIPLPEDTADQRVRAFDLAITAAGGRTLHAAAQSADDLRGGGDGDLAWVARELSRGQGRSLCVESAGPAVAVQVSYDVTRHETNGGGGAAPGELDRLLVADAMIPLDGKVARIADTLWTPADPVGAARVLYDHVLAQMRYDKPDGGAWGRGDAEWACDSGFGNCTDFHSYFIGLARAKGIPARFEIGFSVAGGEERVAPVGGYHCWAFFWAGPRGWVPVDISEADKDPEQADYFFGTLDADRFTLTGGRDVELDPRPAAGRLNFFAYPWAEVDGRTWTKVTKAFERVREDG